MSISYMPSSLIDLFFYLLNMYFISRYPFLNTFNSKIHILNAFWNGLLNCITKVIEVQNPNNNYIPITGGVNLVNLLANRDQATFFSVPGFQSFSWTKGGFPFIECTLWIKSIVSFLKRPFFPFCAVLKLGLPFSTAKLNYCGLIFTVAVPFSVK